jgi:chromosome segregation ATPase
MASESSEERVVSARLPSAVDEWLDAKATELDVDRETVVVQLLSSYRAASELGDDDVSGSFDGDVEEEVRSVVADRLPDIANAVSEQVDGSDVDASDVEAVESRLEADLDRVERDFEEKIHDVRERVIQVKQETDAKADVDHDHPELDEVSTLAEETSDLAARLDGIEDRLEQRARDRESLEQRVADLENAVDRLDDVEEKLQTVAWVVSDLREDVEADASGRRAVEGLKQSAAEADVDRAVCDSCEAPVDIALLTEPRCPHCNAAVNDVELPGGLFGKPRLTVAKQLESGGEDSNVPDAARRE